MAAVIKIEIQSSGGTDAIKQDVAAIGDAAEGAGKKFSALGEIATGMLRHIGTLAVDAAVAGIQAIGGAISDGIADAKNYAIIAAQTDAVLKSTGNAAGVTAEHIADYASALSDAAGKSLFGDDQIQESTNLLLTFTNIKDATLDAATAISVDMAQALGGAPKDSAIQLGKALNDPIKGITALTRVGVTFSEEQKAQIQAMQEAGDMAGAQAVILAELNKEFGGSAAAAAAATGGWSEFNGRLGEAKETLGAAVLPLLNQLAGFLVETVMPVVEQAANAFAAWLADPAVQAGIAQLGDAITNGLGVAMDVIANQAIPALMAAWALLQPAIAAILPLFSGDVPAALQTTGETFNQLQSTIATVMGGIQAVVNAVLPQIAAFWQAHGQEIMAFVQEVWTRIQAIIQTALQLIAAIVGPALQAIASFINAHGAEIQALLTNTWNAIKAAIDIALTLIQGVLKAALQIIQGDWSGAWETIKAMSARIVQDLITIIQSGVGNIVTLFGGMATQVIDTLSALPGQAQELGRNIIDGIIAGVQAGASALFNVLSDMASQALDAAKDALGIESPSKVFANDVGAPIIEGLIVGIQGMIPGLTDVLEGVASAIISKAKKVTEKVVDDANEMQDALLNQAEGIADKLSGVMSDAFLGTASLDRAKAKAIGALKDITEAQQAEVQKQLAAAAETAGGFGDPKQAAAFFRQRSEQIFELAKLRDQIEKTTDEAAKQRLIEQFNLIGKAQQGELQAIGAKGNTSPLAAITEQLQKLLANPNLPAQFDDPSGVLGKLFAALPQLVAMSQSPVPGSVTQMSTSQFVYSPSISTTASVGAGTDLATAKALATV